MRYRSAPCFQLFLQKDDDVHMGQVTKVRLSCYLVLLSFDSKTR